MAKAAAANRKAGRPRVDFVERTRRIVVLVSDDEHDRFVKAASILGSGSLGPWFRGLAVDKANEVLEKE